MGLGIAPSSSSTAACKHVHEEGAWHVQGHALSNRSRRSYRCHAAHWLDSRPQVELARWPHTCGDLFGTGTLELEQKCGLTLRRDHYVIEYSAAQHVRAGSHSPRRQGARIFGLQQCGHPRSGTPLTWSCMPDHSSRLSCSQ